MEDTLYGGPLLLRWTIRQIALKHRLSLASVYRIWARHGIAVERLGINVDKLKISQDLLLGVTVSRIAGLFYETASPVLALATTGRPFSNIRLSDLSSQYLCAQTDVFLDPLRLLSHRLVGPDGPSAQKFVEFLTVLESKREPDSHIHLLAGVPHTEVLTSDDVRSWLGQHFHVEIHWAPNTLRGPHWTNWVQRWLTVICAFPVQAELADSVGAMTALLNNLPSGEDALDTISIA